MISELLIQSPMPSFSQKHLATKKTKAETKKHFLLSNFPDILCTDNDDSKKETMKKTLKL